VPKVNVSFKENIEELKLYDEVIKQRDKSAFVKDAIESYIKKRNSPVYKTEDR
jgi:hypothetical protein